MNQPTEHPHPRWCTDRQLCSTIGAHTGRPVTVNSRNGDFLSVSLQLALAIVPGAQPFVIVRSNGTVIRISAQQARAVSFSLRALAKQAGAYL